MFWAKILKFILNTKNFVLKNKKILLVFFIVAAISILFIRKINNLKNEIQVLHGQITRYQDQLERDREDMGELKEIYSRSIERQEQLILHYHEDMNHLTEQYQQDMRQLRTDANNIRRRNSITYSNAPSEGTQAITNRLGIPSGDSQ